METIAENLILQFGSVGILVVVLIYYTNRLFKRMDEKEQFHREERREWKDEISKQNQYVVMHFDRTMSVLSEIRTILDRQK